MPALSTKEVIQSQIIEKFRKFGSDKLYNPSHLYFLAFPEKSTKANPDDLSFKPKINKKSEVLDELNKQKLMEQFAQINP